jgi:SAM-dependent methyltransferase
MGQDERRAGLDWSLGRYEHTAAQLLGAARRVVERAGPVAGERVLDVGCGTGSAALLAAERGARVTGVDPAPRLLEVARQQAAARGLDATFLAGEAGSLPLEDAAAEVIVSSFGVIFAPDAAVAAAELGRVAGASARMVLSAWLPEGPVFGAVGVLREGLGGPPARAPFAWHDGDAVSALLGPRGFEVAVEEAELAFTAASLDDHLDGEFAHHPPWVAGRAALEAAGRLQAVRARMASILQAGNEDPDGFRVRSRYVLVCARRYG